MFKDFPYHIVDLTHTLDENTPSWNGGCGFGHEVKLDYDDCDTEVKFRVQQIKMHAGIGTHIDAPSHCIKGGKTVEAIDLEDLIAPVVVMDVSKKMKPDYKLSPEDINDFESQYGEIPEGCFIIIHTGWSQYWGVPDKYHNNQIFPSVSGEAAALLLSKKIVGIGIDTLSPDVPSSGFPVHHMILGASKYIIENIANSGKLPKVGAYVMIMPLKAAGLTEAPVRMLGLINK